MNFIAIINGENTVNIGNYDPRSTVIDVLSDDLQQIKQYFSNITQLQIYRNNVLVSETTKYNTYSSIQYIGDNVWVDSREGFYPVLRVELTKANLVETVERLQEIVEPTVDVDSMTDNELISYKLKEISMACSEDIYSGTQVTLSDGTIQHFSFNQHDQINLKTLFDLCLTNPDVSALPYHADQASCEMISRENIIRIYTTLLLRLTERTTYCNGLNMYVRDLGSNREEVLAAYYGMDLTGTYLETYASIMEQAIAEMQKMINQLLPENSTDESTEEDTTEESTDSDTSGESTEPTE